MRALTLPSYSYVTNTYDSVARLLSTTLQTPQSVVLDSHQYQYNAAGQRTRQTRLHGDYAGYTYDNSGQLKTALGLESGGATRGCNEQFRYGYDFGRQPPFPDQQRAGGELRRE